MKRQENTKSTQKRILKHIALGALMFLGLLATITGAYYGIKRCKERTSNPPTPETEFSSFTLDKNFTLNKTIPIKKPQEPFYSLENLPKGKNATFSKKSKQIQTFVINLSSPKKHTPNPCTKI